MGWGKFEGTQCLAIILAILSINAKSESKINLAPVGLSHIRVLVDRIPNNDSEKIVITGQALGSSQGHIFRSRTLTCENKISVPSTLLSLSPVGEIPQSLHWNCTAAPHDWTLKKSMTLKDRSGFLQYKSRWYRGTVELLPQNDFLYIINHVPIDDYIASLIHGEMPESYPIEALKAQAVAARSYAVAQANKRRKEGLPWDLKNGEKDQVYPGAQKESTASLQASFDTKDQYLVNNGEVLKAYYSAASGGHSELPSAVWGRANEDAPFTAKPNAWDKGRYQWNMDLSKGIAALWERLGNLIDIQVISRTPGARVSVLKLVGSQREINLTSRNFAKKLGMGSFKSLKFDIEKNPTGFTFKGEGWGHGVGLSQVAAQKMALAGLSYKKILEFHYPKVNLKVLSSPKETKAVELRIPTHAR